MNVFKEYFDFLFQKGIPLSSINEGSDEFAIEVKDYQELVSIIKKINIPILGGDVLILNDYLEYTGDNWYCEKNTDESEVDYISRSLTISETYLNYYNFLPNKVYYVVFVI